MTDSPSPSSLNALRIDRSAPAARKRRPWGWIVAGGVVLAGGVAWWLAPKPVPVQTTAVVTATASQQHVLLTASGYVVAQRRAAVASKATGRLVALNVREGSVVREGELIARIDDSDVQAAIVAAEATVRQAEAGVRQAEVELANARAELGRSQGLQAQGFISPQAVDVVQTRAQGAQAAVAAARASLAAAQAQVKVQQVARSFTDIRAPFDGVVLVKNANVGDIITPLSSAAGTQGAVVTMADMRTLEVEADVSEGSLSKARIGQPVEIMLDALPGVRFMGEVGGLVPTVDRAKATVTTKIRFQKLDERILPEMSAKVNFLAKPITVADQQPVLAVPPKALHEVDGRTVLWRVKAHAAEGASAQSLQVEAVAVKAGRMLGDVREVQAAEGAASSALKAGDQIVTQADRSLKPGQSVKPAQSE